MHRLLFVAFALLGFAAGPAAAQQFVYEPVNPNFGGSYLNYSWLLSSAQAQNDYEDQRSSAFNRDPLADFEQGLQRQILSQLSRELIADRFRDLDLSEPGRYDFGDFTVDITPGLNEIVIRVFNVLTGDESVISIPTLP